MYNRFKEGRKDVNDDSRPSCPSTSTTDANIETVKKVILNNRRITIRERLLMMKKFVKCKEKTVFLDCNDLVNHEFLPQGHRVNKKY